MRTLFGKFLLWFWVALVVVLAAQTVLEAVSLREGIVLSHEPGTSPLRFYAELSRETLAQHGPGALDSLVRRFETRGLAAYCVDSLGRSTDDRPVPAAAGRAARSALRARNRILVETSGGLFLGYPVGRHEGRGLALVLHPMPPREGRRIDLVGHPEHSGEWDLEIPGDLVTRAIVLLVLGGVGSYLLARSVTAPVARLREATRRLAAGDLSARVGSRHGRRRDELADLGRDFDRMADRLESLVSAQRRLVRDISHELRSPLARIGLATALLRRRGGPETHELLDRLEAENARLNEMIGELLALSQAEVEDSGLETRPVDLAELLARIAEDAGFEAEAGGRGLRVARTAPVTVTGVPMLLRSAIMNAVRNAVRHTAEGTTVEIALDRVPGPGEGEAVVSVADRGPGVPAADLERIFEPFYRVDAARARTSGGTGLGLAIARRAVARHGGTITAAPREGGGLVVTIRLPVRSGSA